MIRICAHIYDKMELSRLDRPDWNGNLICINHLYGNKICLKHPKISPVLQINGHLMMFQTLSRNILKYFWNILCDWILNLTPAVATWYTDAFWSSVICLFIETLHSVNILSVDIPKNCNVPPQTFQSRSEHWTFQLTSHRQMFLIFYTHWSGEVFEGWSGNWPELSTFKEFFQICSKKHWNSLIPLVNFYRCHMWCFRWI